MGEQPRKWIDTRDKPGLLFAMMRKFAINSHRSKVIKEILFRGGGAEPRASDARRQSPTAYPVLALYFRPPSRRWIRCG